MQRDKNPGRRSGTGQQCKTITPISVYRTVTSGAIAQPDFAAVAVAALTAADAVLAHWLPNGQRHGAEYLARNPTRADNRSGSFKINLDTGQWADFATGHKGGDLVALVAYVDSVSQSEAARRLTDFLNLAPVPSIRGNGQVGGRDKDQGQWTPRVPVPSDAPKPPARHSKLGAPSCTWTYRDRGGKTLFHVCRFETSEGKETRPLTFCQGPDGHWAWRWQALPPPRPLYHLDALAARPEAVVIVCGDEKAADAAAKLFPDGVTTTAPNGAQSPGKADWSPLAGRRVWIWPGHDEPGYAFAAAVAKLVQQAGAAEVLELRIQDGLDRLPQQDTEHKPTLTPRPENNPLPPGWDAADALAESWTAEHVATLRQDPAFLREPRLAQQAARAERRDGPKPHFALKPEGVFWHGVDKDGQPLPPDWVCSPLEITALTRDIHGENWGRLLEFPDQEDRRHRWAMPMAMLKGSGEELRGELLRLGLTITTSPRGKSLLSHYIQQARPQVLARCVERTGWHDGAFVFPTRTLGERAERVLFQANTIRGFTYAERGTLQDWRDHVAALCTGNSRLVFALSCGFAAMLLELAGEDSGGFHLRGDSSTGKTRALLVAASIYGGPDYLQRWRATDNGLEALALQHTDTLLILDELAQIDARVVGESCYMLANGEGKTRASRSGAARPRADWRLLFLSAGEIGLAEHMRETGKKARAGQEARLADIPADAGQGLGIFEDLHGYPTAAAFAEALKAAAILILANYPVLGWGRAGSKLLSMNSIKASQLAKHR